MSLEVDQALRKTPKWTANRRGIWETTDTPDGRHVVDYRGNYVFDPGVKTHPTREGFMVIIPRIDNSRVADAYEFRKEAEGWGILPALVLNKLDQTSLGKWWNGENFSSSQSKVEQSIESDIRLGRGLKWGGLIVGSLAAGIAAKQNGFKRMMALGGMAVGIVAAGLGQGLEHDAASQKKERVAGV